MERRTPSPAARLRRGGMRALWLRHGRGAAPQPAPPPPPPPSAPEPGSRPSPCPPIREIRGSLSAGVLAHCSKLVGGDIEAITRCVCHHQVITLHTGDAPGHHPLEATDPVAMMDHIVARREVPVVPPVAGARRAARRCARRLPAISCSPRTAMSSEGSTKPRWIPIDNTADSRSLERGAAGKGKTLAVRKDSGHPVGGGLPPSIATTTVVPLAINRSRPRPIDSGSPGVASSPRTSIRSSLGPAASGGAASRSRSSSDRPRSRYREGCSPASGAP